MPQFPQHLSTTLQDGRVQHISPKSIYNLFKLETATYENPAIKQILVNNIFPNAIKDETINVFIRKKLTGAKRKNSRNEENEKLSNKRTPGLKKKFDRKKLRKKCYCVYHLNQVTEQGYQHGRREGSIDGNRKQYHSHR